MTSRVVRPTRLHRNEAALSREIVQALHGRGAWAVKTHGDPRQRRGLPDILAIYRGYGIGLEVKLPGKEMTVTKLQAHTLTEMKAAGGLAVVVVSVAQALAILDRIDAAKGGRQT